VPKAAAVSACTNSNDSSIPGTQGARRCVNGYEGADRRESRLSERAIINAADLYAVCLQLFTSTGRLTSSSPSLGDVTVYPWTR
jgi:hypothetical protein